MMEVNLECEVFGKSQVFPEVANKILDRRFRDVVSWHISNKRFES